MTEMLYRPGLEGIIAGETHVSTVEQDDLAYRGYRIADLAERSNFEEVAYLLIYDELPNAAQLKEFKQELDANRALPEEVLNILRNIPAGAGGMDVLRTCISALGHFDVTEGDDADAMRARAIHALAATPSIIAARIRLLEGKDPVAPQPGLSHAAQFLWMATEQEPSALAVRLLDLTLILYAEHEFNASAFAARVCISTLSDMYSALVTGVCTLKGPLHGGANEEAIKLINRFASAEEATKWTNAAIDAKHKIMGFGHRVYKNGDHRARILEPLMADLARERGEQTKLDVYFAIKNTVFDRKQIHMNVDFPCGLTYYLMGLPIDVYTPLFVGSRITGWAAHAIEQYTNNRIIRPRSKYVGPALRDYVPLEARA